MNHLTSDNLVTPESRTMAAHTPAIVQENLHIPNEQYNYAPPSYEELFGK